MPPMAGSSASNLIRLILGCCALLFLQRSQLPAATLPGKPVTPSTTPGRNVGFTLLAPVRTGVLFTNSLNEFDAARNRVLMDGSGVATGDFDGDGRTDLFLCSLNSTGVLYRNLGNFQFTNVTESAGLTGWRGPLRGAVFVDINGDGWLDLLVTVTGHSIQCFTNNGAGRFAEFTPQSGLGGTAGSTTLALADVDGNGTLDLYCANYRSEDIRDRPGVDLQLVGGKLTVPPAWQNRLLVVGGEVLEYGEPDQLFLNDGRGHFTAVPWTTGTFLDESGSPLPSPPRDWGLSASFRDINGDGLPDLYVCNDYWTPDRLWLNQGNGRFRLAPTKAFSRQSANSMGIDFADLDHDGHLDFFTVDMLSRDPRRTKRSVYPGIPAVMAGTGLAPVPQAVQNALFHNRGDGTFEEIAWKAGVAASEWSWQPLFIDVDLDGNPDLVISAGHLHDIQDLDANAAIDRGPQDWRSKPTPEARQAAYTQKRTSDSRLYPKLDHPLIAFRNLGNLQFEDMTERWGTSAPGVHHGMALADLDGDGDLDLVVNNLNGAAAIYRNECQAPRVKVMLQGRSPNTQAVGAKVTLIGGAVPEQSQEVVSGGRYLSGSDTALIFAAGTSGKPMSLRIQWRNGRISNLGGILANQSYVVTESEVEAEVAPTGQAKLNSRPLFENWSDRLAAVENPPAFDDRSRQLLLPKSLSRLGPGLAWFDVNRDGLDDLIIGGTKGGRMSIQLNQGGGRFIAATDAVLQRPITRDQTGVIGRRNSAGESVLLAGSSNYEDALPIGASVRQFQFSSQTIDDSIRGQPSSTGPICLADFDGDGELDLFVGGRVVPGKYPAPATSLFLRGRNAQFQFEAELSRTFENVGLVSGATAADLDGDGKVELILACEWGPLRVFSLRGGNWKERTAELGLDKFSGWWNGVVCGDFDGDGRLDLAAGNWGLNSPYQATVEHPISIHFGEYREPGTYELIESQFNSTSRNMEPVSGLDELARSIPVLRERFSSYRHFSEATISEVLAALPTRPQSVHATTLESSVFLNRGGLFEKMALPAEAQNAAAFGMAVADFDGDGKEDLFLAQNFSGGRDPIHQSNGGVGLLLLGNGTGTFRAATPADSGVRSSADQRAAAVADFDQDGRPDLAVSVNGGKPLLLRNSGGKPGLRIKLQGSAGNPDAIGAVLRIQQSNGLGAARVITAGSGYWSQDSSTVVMAASEAPTALEVAWPDGTRTSSKIPAGAREIKVDGRGGIQVLK